MSSHHQCQTSHAAVSEMFVSFNRIAHAVKRNGLGREFTEPTQALITPNPLYPQGRGER